MKSLLIVLALVLLSACEQFTPYRDIVVESDTQWSGYVGDGVTGYSVEGTGNTQIEVSANESVCWSFQKRTPHGRLKVYVSQSTVTGPDQSGTGETSAAYGVVSGCAE